MMTTQNPQVITAEQQEIKMYASRARVALVTFASAMARLAALKRSPTLNILSKTADTWRVELEKELE